MLVRVISRFSDLYLKNNTKFLLTECKGHTEEHWPEFVAVWTKHSEVCTKTTQSQYFPVWLLKTKNMRLMTVSMETVRMANPNQERTNQNVRIYLKIAFPYDKNS